MNESLGWVGLGVAAFTAITSWWLARKASRDKDTQEKIALRIASDKAKLDSTQQALDAYERLNTTHQNEIDRMNQSAQNYRDLLASERKLAQEERAAHSRLVEKYRTALMELLQALLVLRKDSGRQVSDSVDRAMDAAAELMKAEDHTNPEEA